MDHDDTPRELQATMLYGRIHSVQGSKCRVASGGIVTGDLPWFAWRAGNVRRWSPPSVGEQVLLLCPGGDTLGAVALLGVYSDAYPAPSQDHDEEVTLYPDGAEIRYHHGTHTLTATLPDGSTIDVTATTINIAANVNITGKLVVDGDTDCTGTIAADVDVTADGVSLKSHRHGGVQTGGGQTGEPT